MRAGFKIHINRSLDNNILKPCILLLAYINFFLPILKISNVTPSIILGILGVLTYFLPGGNRLSKYSVLCLAYILYIIFIDVFIFTEMNGTVMPRSMGSAFFSGAAIFYALGQDRVEFAKFLSSIIVITAIGMGLFCIIDENFFEKIIWQGRLKMFMRSAMDFAYIISVIFTIAATVPLYVDNNYPRYNCSNYNDKLKVVFCYMHNRYVLLLAVIISCAALLWNETRTGIIAALCAVSVTYFFAVLRRAGPKRALALAVLGVVLLFSLPHIIMRYTESPGARRILSAIHAPFSESSFKSRIPIWLSAWDAFSRSPVIGNGPKAFYDGPMLHQRFLAANYKELSARFGRYLLEADTKHIRSAHNQYLSILVDQGGIGLGLFLALLLYPLRSVLQGRASSGLLLPLIVHWLVFSLTGDIMVYSYLTYFPAFVLFSALGYFACLEARPAANIANIV